MHSFIQQIIVEHLLRFALSGIRDTETDKTLSRAGEVGRDSRHNCCRVQSVFHVHEQDAVEEGRGAAIFVGGAFREGFIGEFDF